MPRVRAAGFLLADNVLYEGEVVQEDPSTNGAAIRPFNAHVLADDRVSAVMLPIADGLTVACKQNFA